MDELEKDKVG